MFVKLLYYFKGQDIVTSGVIKVEAYLGFMYEVWITLNAIPDMFIRRSSTFFPKLISYITLDIIPVILPKQKQGKQTRRINLDNTRAKWWHQERTERMEYAFMNGKDEVVDDQLLTSIKLGISVCHANNR